MFECQICFGGLDKGTGGIVATACGHVFHSGCLAQWHRASPRNRDCPICRAQVRGTHRVQPPKALQPKASTPETPARSTPAKRKKNQLAAPKIKCQNEDCYDLRLDHQDLQVDFEELREDFETEKKGLTLATAKKKGLTEQRDKLAKEQAERGKRIRELMEARAPCPCQDPKAKPVVAAKVSKNNSDADDNDSIADDNSDEEEDEDEENEPEVRISVCVTAGDDDDEDDEDEEDDDEEMD